MSKKVSFSCTVRNKKREKKSVARQSAPPIVIFFKDTQVELTTRTRETGESACTELIVTAERHTEGDNC